MKKIMKRILVIEDDIDIGDNIVELLEENNFKVYSAVNGAEGIKRAETELPDLILCDIMMPVIDGYEVKKKLMQNKSTALIPFLFLTAKGNLASIREGMLLGADDYIVKPYNSNELVESIRVRLNKYDEIIASTSIASNEIDREFESEGKIKNKIMVPFNNGQKIIDISTIKCITSYGNYSNVFSNDDKIMVRKLIKDWEAQLPHEMFLRIHQSTIININFI